MFLSQARLTNADMIHDAIHYTHEGITDVAMLALLGNDGIALSGGAFLRWSNESGLHFGHCFLLESRCTRIWKSTHRCFYDHHALSAAAFERLLFQLSQIPSSLFWRPHKIEHGRRQVSIVRVTSGRYASYCQG